MFTRSRVVVVGAGNICNGFLFHAEKEKLLEEFDFLVLDNDPQALSVKKRDFPFIAVNRFDADQQDLSFILKKNDWVLSLLPARYHKTLAEECLLKECHLLTSSYFTDDLKHLKEQFVRKKLVFMTELGLDPGIDQILAVNSITELQKESHQIVSFKSYAGSCFNAEDKNDWGYRITWNPENIINAGKEETTFLDHGKKIDLSYKEVFKTPIDEFSYEGINLEVYPNRNSYKFLERYNLPSIETFIRGTIRKKGFLELWYAMVSSELTSKSLSIPQYLHSYAELVDHFNLSFWCKEALKKLKLNDDSFKKYSTTYEWLLGEIKSKWSYSTNFSDERVFLKQQIAYKSHLSKQILTRNELLVFRNKGSFSAMSSVVGKVLCLALKKVQKNPVFFLKTESVVTSSFSNDLLSEVLLLAQDS